MDNFNNKLVQNGLVNTAENFNFKFQSGEYTQKSLNGKK